MQAAAKAAAAAEAASAARAAQEEACSTYTHGDVVAAVDSQAHTSAEPRNLRRKSAVAVCFCTGRFVHVCTLHTHVSVCVQPGASCRWIALRLFLQHLIGLCVYRVRATMLALQQLSLNRLPCQPAHAVPAEQTHLPWTPPTPTVEEEVRTSTCI